MNDNLKGREINGNAETLQAITNIIKLGYKLRAIVFLQDIYSIVFF